MTHLLAISIGPVQEFIAAARRTSDLTAGSQLLVDIAKAVARAVREDGGKLIFPADSETDGPNKILAELPVGVCPSIVATAAKAAAKTALRKHWDEALGHLHARRHEGKYDVDKALAEAQIETFLEFYAAWIPFAETDYADKRRDVDALLAARKALRDFGPAPAVADATERIGIYAKSQLDPAYECCLRSMPPIEGANKGEAGYLRLLRTEFLDAVSVLKRVSGRKLGEGSPLPSTRDFARLHTNPAWMVRGDWSDQEDEPEEYGYFAVLVADGDRMGDRILRMSSPDEHRVFSLKLAEFAQEARGIVRAEKGYPVYAGGDDVLALLPVDNAIDCARRLSARFQQVADGASLSAGIAVSHYRQPLLISLRDSRAAERRAKDAGRDRLTLAIHTRGGQPLTVTRKWSAWAEFDKWTEAFRADTLTRGVAYELRDLAQEFTGVPVPEDLLRLEALRVWKRKKAEAGGDPPAFPDDVASDAADAAKNVASLARFADLLVAARFLTSKGDA